MGAGNALLWHLPEDMAYFRAQTMGHPVVMGRKTWESLPPKYRPLPGRRNIVVTAQAGYVAEGAVTAASPQQALALAAQPVPGLDGAPPVQRIFIIGGPQLWAAVMDATDTLLITEVLARYPQADSFFPPIPASFKRESLPAHAPPLGNADAASPPLCFTRWQRHIPG